MEGPPLKKVKLRNCVICTNVSNLSAENGATYMKFLINQMVPLSEKRHLSISEEEFDFCIKCVDTVQELEQLQECLQTILRSIKKKEIEIKSQLIQSKQQYELNKSVKWFRDIVTRDLCPVVKLKKCTTIVPVAKIEGKSQQTAVNETPNFLHEESTSKIWGSLLDKPPDGRRNDKSKLDQINNKPSGVAKKRITSRSSNLSPSCFRLPNAQNYVTASAEHPGHSKASTRNRREFLTENTAEMNPHVVESYSLAYDHLDTHTTNPVTHSDFEMQSEFVEIEAKNLPFLEEESTVKFEPWEEDGTFKIQNYCGSTESEDITVSCEPQPQLLLENQEWPKPPLTYEQLCILAILCHDSQEPTIEQIFEFFRENFPAFKGKDNVKTAWKSQVERITLRKKCFSKSLQLTIEDTAPDRTDTVYSFVGDVIRDLEVIHNHLGTTEVMNSMAFPDKLYSFKKVLEHKILTPQPVLSKKRNDSPSVANTTNINQKVQVLPMRNNISVHANYETYTPTLNFTHPSSLHFTCEDLCILAIMTSESMLVSEYDAYIFITVNFPFFYNSEHAPMQGCILEINSVLNKPPLKLFAKWVEAVSESDCFSKLASRTSHQNLHTVSDNGSFTWRETLSRKLNWEENIATMAYEDLVHTFLQSVSSKHVVPNVNNYITQKMRNRAGTSTVVY